MDTTCPAPPEPEHRPRVLVVDDSKTFVSLLTRRIQNELDLDCDVAMTCADGVALASAGGASYLAALLDLNLPDAPNGEIVDAVLARSVPSIIFTAEINDDLRDQFWSKHIIDYVLKQNLSSVDYIIDTLRRMRDNPDLKVLVVDDSAMVRNHLSALLAAHRYRPRAVRNAGEALAALKEDPEIKIVIIDYNMPDMDGADLTKLIRTTHSKKDLAILGISGHGGMSTSVRFLKNGANDYITKPFLTEEFYCRISQNVDILNQFDRINDLVNKDYLTRLHNRKYLTETGEKFFANLKRHNIGMVTALIDIDDFKRINDAHGHDVGDAVLRHMAGVIRKRFRESDIVARYGGEEFCVVNINMDKTKAYDVYDGLRLAIEQEPYIHDCAPIPLSVSIGVCTTHEASFAKMVAVADQLMYDAKNKGKNHILVR
ncbi:MAG: diguanylate cyclase [Acidobacteriota bacterium]